MDSSLRSELRKKRTSSIPAHLPGQRVPSLRSGDKKKSRPLKQSRGALAAADAHGYHAVAGFAASHLVGHGSHHARAGHAKGMSDGNRSAVDVQLLRINSQAVAAIDHLHRESFVEFPNVDVAQSDAGTLQQFRDGEYRTDAHFVGVAAGDLKAAKDQLVGNAQLVVPLA